MTADFVVASAVDVPIQGCPETYLFPANSEGAVLSWLELPGSFKGERDHRRALVDAGYEVVEEAVPA